MELKKQIGTFSLLCTALSGIIGSGWLFGAFYAAQAAGPAAIVAWAIGGVLMMVVALTFVELACLFPEAGSVVKFSEMSHGPVASLLFGWVAWLSCITVPPIETLALIQYMTNYIPHLMIKHGSSMVLTREGMGLAVGLLFLLVLLNRYGVKIAARANNFLVILKVTVPILTVMILIHHGLNFAPIMQVSSFMPTGIKGVLSALPLAGIVFSFIGYNAAVQLVGEAKNPQRSLPIAVIGALSIGIIFYVAIQVVFLGSLQPNMLHHGWAHLSFSGEAGPFAGLMAAIGIGWFVYVLYFDAIISPFGTAFVYTLSAARINYALAKRKKMPTVFMRLNRFSVPWIALVFNYLFGLILLLPFPGWQSMVGFLITSFVLVYSIAPLAVSKLRRLHPEKSRSFHLPFEKITAPLAFYICNLLLYWTGWETIYKLLLLIAVGVVIMTIAQCCGQRWVNKDDLKATFWLPIYLIGVGLISWLGNFGGGTHLIGFGWDFLVIALFSAAIFYLSLQGGVSGDVSTEDELDIV